MKLKGLSPIHYRAQMLAA
ncbi:hypothetical protein [Arthrobacter sp. V1I9]